jgi:VIT1/CCC1 family predicted Fe2+/Mn2+ transporter
MFGEDGIFSGIDFGSVGEFGVNAYKTVKEYEDGGKSDNNTTAAEVQQQQYVQQSAMTQHELISGVDNRLLYGGGFALGALLLVLIAKG